MKDKNMANLGQYRAVLDDLFKQRSELQFKIGEIDAAVAALTRLMPPDEPSRAKDSQQVLPISSSGKFSGMSTRWAVLCLLSEDATGPMNTGQIAETLQANGMASSAKSFAGNVSAVLSGMNHDRGEVIATTEGWIISEKGKNAWIHIKASRERKTQLTEASLPIEQQQPFVQ